MKAKLINNGKLISKEYSQAINDEIRRRMMYAADVSGGCFDACVLLALNQTEGWGKRRLRKFWEAYDKFETEMLEYFQSAPMSDKDGRFENQFYALEMLKRIGVDAELWRKERSNWTADNDEVWKSHG